MGYKRMEERRRHKRMDLRSKLLVKRLDKTEPDEIGIEVSNMSKSGIGFSSEEILDIGAVYEAFLTIWNKERIHAFIEIVRIEITPECFEYGGIFIGMPEVTLQRIDVYEMLSDAEKEEQGK